MPIRTVKATRDLLTSGPRPAPLMPSGEPLTLPEPAFPQHAERIVGGTLHIGASAPPGEFQPSMAYLFTEWRCDLDCHACWAYQNPVRCMTEDTARRSIDWLHDTGCRAVALMGGEVLLRPQFAHKVVYYAAKRGFSVQVTTHGRRLQREVIDQLGDASVAAVELSVSSDADCQKLSQALRQNQPALAYLLEQQHLYGFAVLFGINISRVNRRDVEQLAQIAGSRRGPSSRSTTSSIG